MKNFLDFIVGAILYAFAIILVLLIAIFASPIILVWCLIDKVKEKKNRKPQKAVEFKEKEQ